MAATGDFAGNQKTKMSDHCQSTLESRTFWLEGPLERGARGRSAICEPVFPIQSSNPNAARFAAVSERVYVSSFDYRQAVVGRHEDSGSDRADRARREVRSVAG